MKYNLGFQNEKQHVFTHFCTEQQYSFITPPYSGDPERTRVPPPPLVLPHPLSFPRGGWGTVTCSSQKFSLQLTVLLWQNHHPRVLPKAFQWKV